MNLRSFLQLLGFRPSPKTYGYHIATFNLPVDGRVELAQWEHPAETPKVVEQGVVDHLRTFLQPGDVAIDIGAHTGDTTVPMALAVGVSGQVFALEPNPYVFPVLAANAGLNTTKIRITPLAFAATERSGPVTFAYSDSGFCNGGEHQGVGRWRHAHAFNLTVRGENLAAYLAAHYPGVLGRLRFIKVDAEGADLSVLQSLVALVDRYRPFIRAEVHKFVAPERRRELFAWFESRSYTVHRVATDTNYFGERLAAEDMSRWRQFDVFAAPAR
jgi:FkbM family methyltransferase